VSGEWHDEDGVVTAESRVLAGESWDVSRVILSWEDVDSRGAPGEAYNVVIHEFAHYLDHEFGGTPWIEGDDARRRWIRLLDEELQRLRAQAEAGERSFLDPYAAEDRSEFFAVASEAFFEEPALFASELPALYRAFADVYRLDPAAWS
jgi:Mlc titration factor MtfA (ptsG expression regulator)